MIIREKIVLARTAPVAAAPSIGIKHAVLLNTIPLSAVTRIINRPNAGQAAHRLRDIVDPAVHHRAEKVAGLKGDVVTIAFIGLPTVGRAVRRLRDIAAPADLRRATTIAGLTRDVVTTVTIALRIVDRAVVRSTAIAAPAVRHHAEAVTVSDAASDGRTAWITVVVTRLTSRLDRHSHRDPVPTSHTVVPQ